MVGEYKKSSFCDTGSCVEVEYKKSSLCSDSACVEVAEGEPIVRVRQTENPDQIIVFGSDAWRGFIEGVKAGEFDLDD